MKLNPESQLYNYPSIQIEKFENEEVERLFLEEIDKSYTKLKGILPGLPEKLKVVFEGRDNYDHIGTDGYAVSSDTIGIGINADVEDRGPQFAKIQSLVFHECYHMRQGFHYDTEPSSALEAAIYEGCATIFERDYADSAPLWGNYQQENEETLRRWYEAMKAITAEEYFEESGETWKKWAFYDPETHESWRVYKVGTWLVDGIMKAKNLDIVDLHDRTAKEILDLINLG